MKTNMTIEDKQVASMEATLKASIDASIKLTKMLIDKFPNHENYKSWENILITLTKI